jgi:hypothetical protein
MKIWTLVATVGLALLGSVPGFAQNPTPISSCPFSITAPGNYVVTRNLTSVGNCISFLVDGVAIDLQGHSITGNGTGVGIGYPSVPQPHIIIANGTIARFGSQGINAGGGGFVANMIVQGNTLDGVAASTVVDSIIAGNGHDGISSGHAINNVQVTGNDHDGILLSGNPTVSNSTVSDNGRMGIIGGGNITAVVVKNNGANGIELDSVGNVIADSIASGNGGDGIFMPNGGVTSDLTNNIVNNAASNNGGRGIFLGCPSEAFGNTATKNAGGNLVTSDNTCVLLNNKVQ